MASPCSKSGSVARDVGSGMPTIVGSMTIRFGESLRCSSRSQPASISAASSAKV